MYLHRDDEVPTATQETPRNELTQRPTNLPVPAAAVAEDNENVSVKKRWYRRHRSTTDIIFAARQLGKKCPEMRIHVYSTLVYRTKVFDTVNREGLRKSMQRFGRPERFNSILRQHHDRMPTRVTDNGAVSEAFAVTNGVKQGRLPTPSLSKMIMDVDESASSTGRCTNSSVSARCIFICVHPLFPSKNCSSSTTAR
nr:unnamed protein product [Spirometra erinaceieuropaei]